MTPCEKLGYKVGDKFEATEKASAYFEPGEIIFLKKDDGSSVPLFSNGKKDWFLGLKYDVKPLPITLLPGDYCSTANMTESEYHAVAAAFMAAGADIRTKSDNNMRRCIGENVAYLGWDHVDNQMFHAINDGARDQGFKRHLTPAQIIGAVNAKTTEQEKPMHPIDNLHTKRQARDVAEKQYQAALAEVREAYPWIRIEEKVEQPTEYMSDPANWRAGDVVRCVDGRESSWWTEGKEYTLFENRNGELFVMDDDGDTRDIETQIKCDRFTFIRRHNTNNPRMLQ